MTRIVTTTIAIFILSHSLFSAELQRWNSNYIYPHKSERIASTKADKENHKLVTLWQRYNRLSDRDLPKQEKQIIEEIMQEALHQKLAWDYYDATEKYIQAISRINYQQADEAAKIAVEQALGIFGPLVDYMLKTGPGRQPHKLEYAISHKTELQKQHNTEFYKINGNKSSYNLIPKFVSFYISNDYEYLLWYIYANLYSYTPTQQTTQILNLLKTELGTTYPNGTYASLRKIIDISDNQALTNFQQEYSHKAISLHATYQLLRSRQDNLMNWKNEPKTREQKRKASSEMADLLADCKAAIRKRDKFSGSEKQIASACPSFEQIISEILSQSVIMNQQSREIELITRNLPFLDVRIMRDSIKGPVILEQHLENTEKSCYFSDTLRLTMPATDDGDYVMEVRSGEYSKNFRVALSRLSVASARTAGGYLFYLCDAFSGEPIKQADVKVLSGRDTLLRLDSQPFDGVTRLDESFYQLLPKLGAEDSASDWSWVRMHFQTKDNQGFTMECSQSLDLAQTLNYIDSPSRSGKILTDRAAYNPGDTIRFKVICWHETSPGKGETYHAGKRVTLELYDSDYQKLTSRTLELNRFGSASGQFVLPPNARNGQFRLELVDGSDCIRAQYVTVDDFVLPDFTIDFAEDSQLKFVGDTLTIRGAVKSFTGHPLSEASAEYSLRLGEQTSSGMLQLTSDGAFEIEVDTGVFSHLDYLQCIATVNVTDGTGKTYEHSTYRFLSNTFAFDAEFLDSAHGRFELSHNSSSADYRQMEITDKSVVRFVVGSQFENFSDDAVSLSYNVRFDGGLLSHGAVAPGDTVKIQLPESGLYSIDFEAVALDGHGAKKESERRFLIYRAADSDRTADSSIDRFFRKVEGDDVAIQFGVGKGPVWAVCFVTDGRNILQSKSIHISNQNGVQLVSFPWRDSWPKTVRSYILYFKDGQSHMFSASFDRREMPSNNIPLSLQIIRDNLSPRQRCSLIINGLPDSECAVAVFDKRTETIMSNYWAPDEFSSPEVYMPVQIQVPSYYNGGVFPFYGRPDLVNSRNFLSKGYDSVVCEDAAESVEAEKVNSDISLRGSQPKSMLIRDNFSRTLCFEPHLVTGDDGKVAIGFNAGDELSTFVVSVYSHNTLMHNGVARDEVVVSIPVKVSVNLPQYLYVGDRYDMAVSVSNISDELVDGRVVCEVYDCENYADAKPLVVMSKPIEVGPSDGAIASFSMDTSDFVDSKLRAYDFSSVSKDVYFKISFCSDSFSDAVFLRVPLREPVQVLTEAHSIVQPVDMSDDEAYERLAGEFIGTSPYGASFSVKSAREIISDFYFSLQSVDSFDALSCSDAIFNMLIANGLSGMGFSGVSVGRYDDMVSIAVSRLLNCFNSDGGFAWVPGMNSSVFVTNHVLKLMTRLAEYGLWKGDVAESALGKALDRALQYVENQYSRLPDSSLPTQNSSAIVLRTWSLDYLLYRSALGNKSPWTGKSFTDIEFSKVLKKDILARLTDHSFVRGNVLQRLCDIHLIIKLLDDDCAFVRSCGFSKADSKRLKKNAVISLVSLVDYAVESSYGAMYYPSVIYSAFASYSEAEIYPELIYALSHAVGLYGKDKEFAKLCDRCNVLDNNILSEIEKVRDGVCLWMLMQKESQSWKDDPHYFNVIYALLSAPDSILNTKVASLSKSYAKPFSQIKETASGMKISVNYYRCDASGDFSVELSSGDCLKVGDKVLARYRVESENDRSLVKLTAARPACLRPVEQLSRWYYSSKFLTASCYREVRADRTVYWLDTLPKGESEFVEELIVTQEGTFQSAASEVVCDYAPHYRSNIQAPLFSTTIHPSRE